MPTYRRRKDHDTWHWCRNCSQWPERDFDEQDTKPTTGESCDECKAKAAKASCAD